MSVQTLGPGKCDRGFAPSGCHPCGIDNDSSEFKLHLQLPESRALITLRGREREKGLCEERSAHKMSFLGSPRQNYNSLVIPLLPPGVSSLGTKFSATNSFQNKRGASFLFFTSDVLPVPLFLPLLSLSCSPNIRCEKRVRRQRKR